VFWSDQVQKVHRDLKRELGFGPFFRGFFRILFIGSDKLHNLVRRHTHIDKFFEDEIIED
jgi:hypothetical protein